MSKKKLLKDIGEFGFLDHIQKAFPAKGRGVIRGIGEDCAVLACPAGGHLLWTVDTLVEDVHFSRDMMDFYAIGWKSLAVNLSDIAAMGGRPLQALLSLGLRDDTELKDLDAFYKGLSDLAREFEVDLVGGDVVRSPGATMITVTALGISTGDRYLSRARARPGDWIVVTGPLGESAAGLKILLDRKQGTGREVPASVAVPLIRAHRMPLPQIREGAFFAEIQEVHAAIDLSDGLAQDLWHVSRFSGVGACVVEDRLPLSSPTRELARLLNLRAENWALSGGEDYHLLVTVSQDALEVVLQRFEERFQRPLYTIGRMTKEPGLWLEDLSGRRWALEPSGYDHFPKGG